MTVTCSPNVDGEDLAELADTFDELQAIAPPPRPLSLSVGGSGRSAATASEIRVTARDVGKPWARGTLAHEYGHVLDPEGRAGLLRRAAWLGAPLPPPLAACAALKLTDHPIWSHAPLVVALLVFARAFARGIVSSIQPRNPRRISRAPQCRQRPV